MKRYLLLLSYLLLDYTAALGIDLTGLQPIGKVKGFTKLQNAIIVTCDDQSQVQISILTADLIRVRASFGKTLPAKDHSWAIAKEDWTATKWNLKEVQDSIVISTSEIETVIHRDPFLIDFREPKTHSIINVDQRPMMFDPKGATIAAAKKLGFEEHFYGLGEKAARLDKRRGHFTNWNSDTPNYKEGTDPIYQSIPFYIGWQSGEAYGIFFDNSYRTHFDFGLSTQEYAAFSAEGGEMNYYFFYGPSMKKILQRYADLTGRMPMPPAWALGNQQSRWSYYPETVAEEVVNQYRQRDLPLDVLYLDIHHMNGYRVFTWDTSRFPDPKAFTDRMKQQGIKVLTIVDPGVKYQPAERAVGESLKPELGSQEKSYYVYNRGLEKNYFAKRENGSLYIGKVWPGESVFVDYTLKDARTWWGDLHRAYTDYGIAGIWTDMNEPADFADQTGKFQSDVVSYDEGERSTHAKNRNVFASLMVRATYEGLQHLQPDKRPYVITRAGYAGYQRYATMWTGDNTSTWEALALSIPMFQSLGLSGVPFVGADAGGFNGRANGELLTRWYQVAFLSPMCRNHMAIDSYDHEPWRFGKHYEDIIRKYLKLRYRLLPFLYTNLEEASRTGLPLFRPLLLNYQNDANTLNIDDQFMIGNDLLVAPILKPDQTSRLAYLPEGSWYDYWSGKKHSGPIMIRIDAPLEIVPMFVRAGAIIPMQPEMNYVGEKAADPITFQIYPDEQGNASISLYEDDGVSPAYMKGKSRSTEITAFSYKIGEIRVNVKAIKKDYLPGARDFVFEIKTISVAEDVLLDNRPLVTIEKNETENGWFKSPNGLTVRIKDDGANHSIVINQMYIAD